LYDNKDLMDLPDNTVAIATRSTMSLATNMIAVDTETTGLKFAEDLLLEIGMYGKIDGEEISYTRLIKYGADDMERINAATRYNGIKFEEVERDGLPIEEVIREMESNIEYLNGFSDVLLIGFNLQFDVGFISAQVTQKIKSINQTCLMEEIRKREAEACGVSINAMRRMSLASALAKYKIERQSRAHRALGDAYETYRLGRAL
jgi:DNA polymerase III epsilon subunit-like protein